MGAMGRGRYPVEARQGADGTDHEWVEGLDGPGEPGGFWKALRRQRRRHAEASARIRRGIREARIQSRTDARRRRRTLRALARQTRPRARRVARWASQRQAKAEERQRRALRALTREVRKAVGMQMEAGVHGGPRLGGTRGDLRGDERADPYRWNQGVDSARQPHRLLERVRQETRPTRGRWTMHQHKMGVGHYVGELRQGPDGQLYEWVEGVDGLGNPIGFWKAIKAAGQAVGKAAGAVVDTAGKAAGVVGKAVGTVVGFLDPVKRLFQIVVATNKRSARRIKVPRHFLTKVVQYSQANPADGRLLRSALSRRPRFYKGGWILRLQPGASAMTLGRNIFFRALTPSTYAHELVHVHQYRRMGVTGFLLSYFGMSALTVLKRMIQRKPLNAMRSSPHEQQAYAVGDRFAKWCAASSPQCNVRI